MNPNSIWFWFIVKGKKNNLLSSVCKSNLLLFLFTTKYTSKTTGARASNCASVWERMLKKTSKKWLKLPHDYLFLYQESPNYFVHHLVGPYWRRRVNTVHIFTTKISLSFVFLLYRGIVGYTTFAKFSSFTAENKFSIMLDCL